MNPDPIPYFTSPILAPSQHGFFTREGGVSQGDFTSLNVIQDRGDNLDHVIENRSRIAKTLGSDLQNLITLKQVHSTKVLIVDKPFSGEIPEADGFVTTTPGLLLGIFTADCVPVLLSSEEGRVVGALHAGWRGATEGIVEDAVRQMRALGAHQIKAALGPCIWQETYEVSQEFYDNLPTAVSFFIPGHRPNHWQFDLPGYVLARLTAAGVGEIDPSPANTYADPQRFFSCRRKTILKEATFGCAMSCIAVREAHS